MKQKSKSFFKNCLYAYRFPRDIIFGYYHFGYWDPTWRLMGSPVLYRHREGKIRIGRNWIACSDARHNSLGVIQKVTIKCFSGGNLIIGDSVGMSGISIDCSLSITIGNNVLIGSGSLITDSDSHPLHMLERDDSSKIQKAPVVIEDGVFIGARALILKGVRIGLGSVIGAGAVVTRDVPPMTVAAGNPARVLSSFT